MSLVSQLEDPDADRARPALTVFRPGPAAVRSARYRLIPYAHGTEDLYDHARDPPQWTNLAARPALADVRRELARWRPREWAAPAARKRAYRFDFESFTWTRRATGEVVRGSRQ